MTPRGVSERIMLKVLLAALCSALLSHEAMAQSPPNLGKAGSFAVLGDTTITCSSSTIAGDVGVYSGAVLACDVLGTTHVGDTVAQQAYADFLAAHAALALVPCAQILTGDLAGVTLQPGVYCFESWAAPTGTLTLDGPSDGIWIFKIGTVDPTGYLASTAFHVVSPGGQACSNNVFWWTAQYATLTTSTFMGTILAGTTITVTGGNLDGRALAKDPVTLTGTFVSPDFCSVLEVSPSEATFPARLTKDASSPTGDYLYFQRMDAVEGYNLYEGTLGSWYSQAGATGNVCNVAATDYLATGEMRATITPSAGDHYYLITAYGGGDEGPSGFATPHQEIDPAQSTCTP
jgi:hypothetical protein